MSGEHSQKFGGFWSLLKVEAIEKYLRAYATAMSKQSFELVYIDTFAGQWLIHLRRGYAAYGRGRGGGGFSPARSSWGR